MIMQYLTWFIFLVFSRDLHHLPTQINSEYIVENQIIYDSLIAQKYDASNPERYKHLVDLIGPVLIPNSTFIHTKKTEKEVIYQVEYKIGPFGNREKPFHNLRAKKHLIFGGESNTFGDGTKLEDTFPYLLANKYSLFQVYNLGHRGGGPNNTLALFQHFNLKSYIVEEEGYFFFNLFSDIVLERVIGTKNHTCWDKGRSPYYKIDDKKLIYKGNFSDRFFVNTFYDFICGNMYLNEWIKNLPRVSDIHYQLMAMILKNIELTYLKFWPKGKFVVVVNHAFENSYLPLNKQIIPWLKKYQIKYVEFPSISYVINRTYKYDQHLNKNGHFEEFQLFNKLIKDLNTN